MFADTSSRQLHDARDARFNRMPGLLSLLAPTIHGKRLALSWPRAPRYQAHPIAVAGHDQVVSVVLTSWTLPLVGRQEEHVLRMGPNISISSPEFANRQNAGPHSAAVTPGLTKSNPAMTKA